MSTTPKKCPFCRKPVLRTRGHQWHGRTLTPAMFDEHADRCTVHDCEVLDK